MFSRRGRAHPASRPDSAQKRLRRGRRTVGVILGSVAVLTCAGTISASEPTRTTEIIHRRLDPWFTCPGFDIIGEFDLIRQITTYFDHDGAAVRRIIHVDVTGTLTHAGTGESLPTSGVRVFHFDLTTGEGLFHRLQQRDPAARRRRVQLGDRPTRLRPARSTHRLPRAPLRRTRRPLRSPGDMTAMQPDKAQGTLAPGAASPSPPPCSADPTSRPSGTSHSSSHNVSVDFEP